MALSTNQIQIQWGGTVGGSVTAGGSSLSDAPTLSATAYNRTIILKADNTGTPASGEKCTFYIRYTLGNVGDAAGNDFTDAVEEMFAVTLDTNAADPATSVAIELPHPIESLKVNAVAENGTGNGYNVYALVLEATA